MATLEDSDTPFLYFSSQHKHLDDVLDEVGLKVQQGPSLASDQMDFATKALEDLIDIGPDWSRGGVACFHVQVDGMKQDLAVLVRLAQPLGKPDKKGLRIRFVWVLVSGQPTHPQLDLVIEFTKLLQVQSFRELAERTEDSRELLAGYRAALESHLRRAVVAQEGELTPSGVLFGGLVNDLRRKIPFLVSDFTDGFTTKTLASVFFLFFACLAPAIAFGGLLAVLTEGQIGVVEMLVASAVAGVVYALVAGQPLTILGSTGPVIIFMGLLYGITLRYGVPYLPTLAWIGLWTCAILLVLVALDASCWIRYFTRFTDEVFAALISLIFIFEAVKDMVHVFTDHKVGYDTALLSLVLSVGTFWVAMNLSRFRRSPYLRRWVREFLADFGPALAMLATTCVAFALHEVHLETLDVPTSLAPVADGPGWWTLPKLQCGYAGQPPFQPSWSRFLFTSTRTSPCAWFRVRTTSFKRGQVITWTCWSWPF